MWMYLAGFVSAFLLIVAVSGALFVRGWLAEI